jgi:sodium transport system permease protein
MTPKLIVARKELLDASRDARALASSVCYALMGPAVVALVSIATAARAGGDPQSTRAMLIGMMSVFTLVSIFVGGMNVAMDAVAGERERRSLLPLLLNPVTRLDVVVGKWLAVSAFATAGLLLNLCGFALVFAQTRFILPGGWQALPVLIVCGFGPLALLAGALELWVSTMCRGIKEAHTWLALLVFAPMGAGMFLVFVPQAAARPLAKLAPMAGQQLQWSRWLRDGTHDPLQTLALGAITLSVTAVVLLGAARLLERDDVVYGR